MVVKGSFPALTNGHQPRLEFQGQRGGEEEPSGLGRGDNLDPAVAEPLGNSRRTASANAAGQARSGVMSRNRDARLGKSRDRADVAGQVEVGAEVKVFSYSGLDCRVGSSPRAPPKPVIRRERLSPGSGGARGLDPPCEIGNVTQWDEYRSRRPGESRGRFRLAGSLDRRGT